MSIDEIISTRPMTKREFVWHRFMLVMKHPFSFKKRMWKIDYIENGIKVHTVYRSPKEVK